jgi:uncharacterized protein
MGSLLVHLTHGPESATRAALALLVARTAAHEGHDVSIFFAGDSVQLLRAATMEATQGIGTGSFREHFDACVSSGVELFASGMSSQARGLAQIDIPDVVELAPPTKLVELIFACDRAVTY